MPRVFTTTELSVDLIKDPADLGEIVTKGVELGLVVRGAGGDSEHPGFYRVQFHTGADRFAEPVMELMAELTTFAKSL